MLTPQFKVIVEVAEEDYGKFVLEPLEKGYGDTLGNALRRCLLASLEGFAVTQVKIDGVRHQFSTLEGMREDIIQLVLNIKKLRIKGKNEKEFMLNFEAKGPGEVKASLIKAPAGVEIINKDLVLANLSDKKSKLNIEMKVEYGFGFSPAEDRKIDTVGTIPVDAAFSPIQRINYKIESTRVGRKTDFDRLILEIWTDGTIKPKEALEKGAEILVVYFKQVYLPTFDVVVPGEVVSENQEFLSLTVEELDLPTRIVNALLRGGYKTVKDLAGAKRDEIAKVKNLGIKSVVVVEDRLKEKSLRFKD